MSALRPEIASEHALVAERRVWIRPAVSLLETGEAEGNDSSGPDGGLVAS